MRDDPNAQLKLAQRNQSAVTAKEANKVVRRNNICKYIECSALTGSNVQEVGIMRKGMITHTIGYVISTAILQMRINL